MRHQTSEMCGFHPTLFLAVLLHGVAACQSPGGTTKRPAGGPPNNTEARSTAPQWFHRAPQKEGWLFFVGTGSHADEGSARRAAIQSALHELSMFCGAHIQSDFESVVREKDQKLRQTVSMRLKVAGNEMTVREAVVQKTAISPGKSGLLRAYALIAWPEAQYRRVLKSQIRRAEQALSLYKEAKKLLEANRPESAYEKTEQARELLTPLETTLPLGDPKVSDSKLLGNALTHLARRIQNARQKKRRLFALGVSCRPSSQTLTCEPRRGILQEALVRAGGKVMPTPLPAGDIDQVLSTQPASNFMAGHILAVRYEVTHTEKSGPFTFAYCRARGVLYNTTAQSVVSAHEVSPQKSGHPRAKNATEKSCTAAQNEILKWIDGALKKDVP